MFKIIFITCSFFALLFPVVIQQKNDFAEMVNAEISHTVPVIYVKDLYEWTQKNNKFYLLDSRSADEYKVSHIENAFWVGYESFSVNLFKEQDKKSLVVVYCSIGYRSEKVSEQLRAAGYKNVFNLWGGIFDWINHGYPVVDMKGNRTNNIHPYSKKMGKVAHCRSEKV